MKKLVFLIFACAALFSACVASVRYEPYPYYYGSYYYYGPYPYGYYHYYYYPHPYGHWHR